MEGETQYQENVDPNEVFLLKLKSFDKGTWAKLIQKERPKLLFVINKILGNSNKILDVFQQTLMAAMMNIKSFKGDSQIETWLLV